MNDTANLPLRILQIIGTPNGGVEMVVLNYYRNIDRSEVQFDFVYESYIPSLYEEEIRGLGGNVYHVASYTKNIFKFIRGVYNIVQNGHYEIVHSHMNTLSVFPLFAAKLAGAKIKIVHSHSTADRKEGIRSFIKYVLRPFASMFATHKVACSIYAAKWLFGESILKKGKVRIINNAINLDDFSYDKINRIKTRQKLKITNDNLVIGHIGRMMFQKNHKFLIDIFYELHKKEKNSILFLVGDGKLREKIADYVKIRELEGNVIFLGWCENTANLYNAMDIFCLPSRYEGLPVVLVEAQANGLPCIVSDKVTKESRLSSSLQFLDLEMGAAEWAQKILAQMRIRNKKATVELRNNGFDILLEAKKITAWYLTLQKYS